MRFTRRRFIAISAAAVGLPLLALTPAGWAQKTAPTLRTWRGVALGADAMLQLNHPDPQKADRLIQQSLAEVHRLERIFSLYREDSAISQLNALGTLDDPPQDLIRILSESEDFSRATSGAFDITVQPLWDLYAAHFGSHPADESGPAPKELAAALARVRHDGIECSASHVRFLREGMAITLNGIGQGYITDRVAELLLASGMEQALVDMGETRALGGGPDGRAWLVGLDDPRSPGQVSATVLLRDRAIATSGGYGAQFDAEGRFNHIFDPKSGRTSSRYPSVTVIAPSATMADALSTAFSLMSLEETKRLVERYRIQAHFVLPDGKKVIQEA